MTLRLTLAERTPGAANLAKRLTRPTKSSEAKHQMSAWVQIPAMCHCAKAAMVFLKGPVDQTTLARDGTGRTQYCVGCLTRIPPKM